MLDFMSQILKQPPTKLKCFDDLFAAASNINEPSTEQIDVIYDSNLEVSIKECDRRRGSREKIEGGFICRPIQ